MYFEDYTKKKTNLGNRNIITKDDFMKKMKEDDNKERKKKALAISQQIIKDYFISSSSLNNTNSITIAQMISNLQSILTYFSNNSLEIETKDQIVIKSIEKTMNDSIQFFKNKNIIIKDKILLMKISTTLLINHLSLFQVQKLIMNNHMRSLEFITLFICLIKISTVELYQNLRNDYLISEANCSLIPLLNVILLTFPQEIIQLIIDKISLNIGQIFLLKYILNRNNKIININDNQIIFEYICTISNKLILKRSIIKAINPQYNPNTIINDFFYNILMCYSSNIKRSTSNPHLQLSLLDICLYINIEEFFKTLSLDNYMLLFNSFIVEMNQKNFSFNDDYANLFIHCFIHLSTFDLRFLNRTIIIKTISDLIELFFKSKPSFTIINTIKLIVSSTKLIENFYKSNYEKTNYQSILNHIVNKIIIKYMPNISNEILTYSVKLLLEKFPNARISDTLTISSTVTNDNYKIISNSYMIHKDIFEIISFFVINQINYKSNYFFVQFKATRDIYQNLPFNYFYLNLLSKYLINLFTEEINVSLFDEIDHLKDNIIIMCLKSLYLLDKDINYSYNHEEFWNNPELIAKLSGKNSHVQIEKIQLIPFIFPLNMRLKISLKEMSRLHREAQVMRPVYDDDEDNESSYAKKEFVIPRNRLFETSLNYYYQGLFPSHGIIQIIFVNKFGQKEEGIDGGGLYREYISKVTEEGFGKDIGLFIESSTGFLLPYQDSSKKTDSHLLIFEFLGFITGKAITEDIKLNVNLSPIFLNNILDLENSFIDLKSYDSEFYKNLVLLMQYQGNVEHDFGLTFSLTESIENNQTKTINLINDGENIPVTNENRLLYIKKVTEYKLCFQFKEQCHSFKKGMEHTTNMDMLKMFTGDELRQLIYGFDKDAFDVDDLRANVVLENWNFNSKEDLLTLDNLWRILREFDEKEKEKFLFFVTSLKRPPIGGFARLQPKFTIFKSDVKIPTSSTCVNMLKLPSLPFGNLKELLRFVINADAGFYYG